MCALAFASPDLSHVQPIETYYGVQRKYCIVRAHDRGADRGRLVAKMYLIFPVFVQNLMESISAKSRSLNPTIVTQNTRNCIKLKNMPGLHCPGNCGVYPCRARVMYNTLDR